MTDIKQLLKVGGQAALEAGKAIMEIYNSGEFETDIKKDQSPLTTADKNAHSIITEHLAKTNLPVLSEEGMNIDFRERKSWEYPGWLIRLTEPKNSLIRTTSSPSI